MTVVNPKSISGITSVTTASGSDNLLTFHTNNTTERLRIDSSGNVVVKTNDVALSGSGTLRINSGSTAGVLNLDGGATNRGGEINLTGGSNGGRIQFRTGQGSGQQDEKMRLDESGRLLVGALASNSVGAFGGAALQVEGLNAATSAVSLIRHSADNVGSTILLAKSRGTADGATTVVQSGDACARIIAYGADGTDTASSLGSIEFYVDGTPGSNDMPGRIVFSTTADGAATYTERMRITNAGVVHIGNTFSAHSEGDDLVIGGSGWRGMTIYGEGGGGVIQFADDGSNRAGQILYSHSTNHMLFRTNGNVDRMMITDDGYIGAGVASPSARFHAQDDSATETVMIKLRNYKSGVNTKPTIHFEAATTTGQGATSEIQGLAGTDAGGSNSANDSGMKFIVRHGGSGTQREAFTLKADGNMYFPSGQGISFSATSDGPSMSSELFDDYEEGTFTPLLGGSNYGTYNVTGTGKYTRVGRAIFCEWKFTNRDLDNNASGQMRIRGWPFAFSADSNNHRPISANFMMHNVQLPTSGDNNIYNLYGDSNGIAMNGMRNNDGTSWSSWDISNFESSSMYFEGSCFMMAS